MLRIAEVRLNPIRSTHSVSLSSQESSLTLGCIAISLVIILPMNFRLDAKESTKYVQANYKALYIDNLVLAPI